MVPKGWEVKSFAKLLKSGDVEKIQDGNHGDSHPKSSDFVKSGIPFVMARDLKKGTVDLENCAYITKEQADSLRIGFAKTGDILLSHKGTVGLVAMAPLCDEYMMLTPQVTYYRIPQDSSLMSSYLYQFLLSHEYQSRFKNLAFQSTRSYLGITAQKELSINLPPLPEQQKIAKILSTWDKAISTTERLIENSTQQKKALMQQLLTGKKRLLGDEGKIFEDEWEEVTLEEAVKYRRGSFPQPYGNPEWVDEVNGYPFVQVYDIAKNMKLKPDTKMKISDAAIDKSVFIPKETIIVSLQGSIGRVAITQYDAYVDRTILLFQEFLVPMNKMFFAYIIQELFEIEKTKAPGGTIKTITKAVLSNFKVLIPPLKEQQRIATVLTNADKEIELLEQQLADLQQEKKALMQVLLTGKKRVVVDVNV